MELILIFLSAAIVNNFVLTYFLGICPFVGVSNKLSSAFPMGMAVTFVMTLTAVVSWLVWNLILVPYGLEYLQIPSFILTIASLVQFVEMFIKKMSRPLYNSLGIFLPLITTNCAILGMALWQTTKYDYTLFQGLFYAVGAGLGLTLALVLMASIRESTELSDVPSLAKGTALTLIIAASLSLAFMGFSGLGSAS